MSAEDQLRTLLQVYLAEYSLYATLLLTGAVGSLSVLQIRIATRRGFAVFTVAYYTFVGIVLYSVWRLIHFSKSVDVAVQKLGLVNLHLEIQQEGWMYYVFRWIFQSEYVVILATVTLALIVLVFMWVEVERYVKNSTKRSL